MKKITLKQAFKNQIDSVELTQEKLDDLMQLQSSGITHDIGLSKSKQSVQKYTKCYAAVATLLIALSIGFFFTISHAPIAEKIIAEVSANHLKLKPLEVNSDQLKVLDNYFTQLDFKLAPTAILNNSNWRLLGARYCSIQGHTAAQLRIENKQTGAIETLYQAPYIENQFSSLPVLEDNQSPVEEYSKGIGVKIWIEKGILFVLTNSNPDS